MKKLVWRIVQHGLIWLLFLLAPFLVLPGFGELLEFGNCHLSAYLLLSSLLIILYYSNYFFFLPRFYANRKYLSFIVSHLLFLLVVFITVVIVSKFIIGPCTPIGLKFSSPFLRLSQLILPRHTFIFTVSLLIYFRERMKEIDAEQSKAELRLLKQQLKPHTLFNMLNTIYGQAVIKSDKTAESIAALSDLMRYTLVDSNRQYVPIAQEVDYLKSYISFEKMRLTDKTEVILSIQGDHTNVFVPPMLFTPIVENAFKFGVSNEIETKIEIDLMISQEEIMFKVSNDIPRTAKESTSSHHIGIENLKSRLKLLYPSRHEIRISENPDHYEMVLKLQLR